MQHAGLCQVDRRRQQALTAQPAQVDLLAAGDDDVGEVVQAQARGQVDAEVAHQQGQEGVQRCGKALAVLVLQAKKLACSSCGAG